MKLKFNVVLIGLLLLYVIGGCSAKEAEKETREPVKTDAVTEDRQGNPITLPEKIERVLTAGPSNAEIMVGLGYGDKVVGADTYSENVEGIPDDIPLFDMTAPDEEKILDLRPDVMLVTGMTQVASDDPYKAFKDAGICVIYIPSSNSIESIKEDIRFIAAVMGDASKNDAVIQEMEQEIARIQEIGESITDKKRVYFEIASAPDMYSFGTGVFLNEMIELIGAENILGDQEEWVSVADEEVLSANPDVILTSVNYEDDPVGGIKSRAGWEAITAVKDDAVYSIDTDASNHPSQNIVKALKEMAKAVYPDKY